MPFGQLMRHWQAVELQRMTGDLIPSSEEQV
jgi:hypothetical protein